MSTVVISSDEESIPRSPKRKRAKLTIVDQKPSKSSTKEWSDGDKENGTSAQSICSSDDAEQHNISKRPESPSSTTIEVCNAPEGLKFFKHVPKIQELLDVCLEKITDNAQSKLFVTKVDYLVKYYKKAGDYVESNEFKADLNDFVERAKKGDLVICLKSFLDLTSQLKSVGQTAKEETPNSRHIRTLEKFLDKLTKKIKALEEQEVDFEQDDNSAYIQMQRYRERAAKVYAKLCKCRKENPQSLFITHRRLDFSDSNYIEINKAINKKFKTGVVFPTYLDVEKCIRKCVSNKKMDISEAVLTAEARHCFEKLGNLLQNRRRLDLHDLHSDYLLPSHLDPARHDPQLNSQLTANRNIANQAINSLCEKYVRLQEDGKDLSVSSDSEDSHYKSAEEDSD